MDSPHFFLCIAVSKVWKALKWQYLRTFFVLMCLTCHFWCLTHRKSHSEPLQPHAVPGQEGRAGQDPPEAAGQRSALHLGDGRRQVCVQILPHGLLGELWETQRRWGHKARVRFTALSLSCSTSDFVSSFFYILLIFPCCAGRRGVPQLYRFDTRRNTRCVID